MIKLKKGFTLIELLVVVAILALLTISAIVMLTSNLAKSRDSKRKADLDRLKTAFEEYYVDNNVYPPSGSIDTCGGSSLEPYLKTIPCDPRTKRAYCYVYDADNSGQNYRVLSSLEFVSDPIIAKLSCDDNPDYCGHEADCVTYGSNFNYGVASSNVVVNSEVIGGGNITPSPSPTPTPSPTPLPSSIPGVYACTPFGNCDNYTGNSILTSCPITFNDGGAGSLCQTYCPSSPLYSRCPAQ